MFLFGKKKKNVDVSNKDIHEDNARIKVLGSGCKKCNDLEDAVKEALARLDKNETVFHVTDFTKISAYGVMSTPALVIDEKVISYGKVLNVEEVLELLKKNM